MSSAPVLPPKGSISELSHPVAAAADGLPMFKLDAIVIPEYLQSLPIKNLKELIDNHVLLRDFVLKMNEEDLEVIKSKTLKQIGVNIETLKELQINLKENILPEQESLVDDLNKLNTKFKQIWSAHELEMYNLLNTYSSHNLITMMNSLVLEVDELSKTLYQSLLSSDKLNDNEISKFIEEYMKTRQLYHLRKEKLYRLKENRVSG